MVAVVVRWPLLEVQLYCNLPFYYYFSGMAILVGLSFFFLLVAEYMPETSEAVPLIGMYYTVTMIEVSCAFFMTCWVLRFHHQNPTEGEVPEWVKVSVLVSRFVLV